jgi:hypothetical protein
MKEDWNLNVGDLVKVRSKEEILKTLDQKGQLDGLPFMPEMFAFCGKQFHVYKRAHKTCDTVSGDYKGRRMKDAVHLKEVRCDGYAHGGCEAGCLIFWKKAWLKKLVGNDDDPGMELSSEIVTVGQKDAAVTCTEAAVLSGVLKFGSKIDGENTFVCQATQIPAATEVLAWWDLRQYLEDYRSGNISLGQMARGLIFMAYQFLINMGIGLGAPLRCFYDLFQKCCRGVPYPLRSGKIPLGGRTPTIKLDLHPGEWVRVKSYDAILATCDKALKNRGMFFDKEMVPYCGRTYRVLKRVNRIIDEKTGKIVELKNPCIILDGVICQSRYSECRLFCPRSIYGYWREIWLEKVSEKDMGDNSIPASQIAMRR